MKIALISDIHGNALALETVLADIDRHHVDQIICLGDTLALGPQPRQVLECLRALGCPCVMGNHDQELTHVVPPPTDDDWVTGALAWCAGQLNDADRTYLATFQPVLPVPIEDGKTMLCCHASPRHNLESILPTTPDAKLEAMLDGHWAHAVIASGHTHTQLLRLYRKTMLVGVGSVGYPIARPWTGRGEDVRTYPWTEYALIRSEGEQIGVEFRRLPMDMALVKSIAQASGMPNLDVWLDMWLDQ